MNAARRRCAGNRRESRTMRRSLRSGGRFVYCGRPRHGRSSYEHACSSPRFRRPCPLAGWTSPDALARLPAMRRALVRRIGALLLATTFIGGGFGLSDLDALLFHSGRNAVPPEVPHFDLPGGCGAHAEHCVLAVAASLRQLGTTATTGITVTRVATADRIATPVATPR